MPTPLDGLAALDAPLAAGSSARWARAGATHCLIFVHGYGGRAVATWGDFADMAMEHPAYAHADLVFLGYESRSRRANFNVGVVHSLVRLLAEENARALAAVHGPARPADFQYERIILIGHSLGGAIVRGVAQGAKRTDAKWADSLRLALFAPAHKGADALRLVQMSVGFLNFSGVLQAAAHLASPALADLDGESEFLRLLLSEAQDIGPHCTTRASIVVQAANDRVVSPDTFFQDPPPTPYVGHNHVSCCKPRRADFDNPLRDVTRAFL